MSISHWCHINTYVSLAIIIAMLAAAIVFSVLRGADRAGARPLGRLNGVDALSPVRMRTARSMSLTQILPSPILPVAAERAMTSAMASPDVVEHDLDDHLGDEVDLVLGAAVGLGVPALTSEPRTSPTVMPATPAALRASFTSSSLNGLMTAVTSFKTGSCGDADGGAQSVHLLVSHAW